MKISIPNPCLENYDNMSPTEIGKMCSICNIEVIDFTNWKEEDIINYIQNANQKVCGKIYANNASYTTFTPWSSWLKIAGTFLILNSWSSIPQAAIKYDDLRVTNKWSENSKYHSSKDSVTLQFFDSQNKTISRIHLVNKDTKQVYYSDPNGIININLPTNEAIILEVNYIGFKTKTIKLNNLHKNQALKIMMEEAEVEIGEIIVQPIDRLDTEKKLNQSIKKNKIKRP